MEEWCGDNKQFCWDDSGNGRAGCSVGPPHLQDGLAQNFVHAFFVPKVILLLVSLCLIFNLWACLHEGSRYSTVYFFFSCFLLESCLWMTCKLLTHKSDNSF